MTTKSQKITLLLLLCNLFISFIGISIVIPVLPTIMNEMSLPGSVVGYMVAAYSIAQLIVSPIAGRWADRFGRKLMIIIGLILSSISELLFGLGETVEVLFLSRILGGISGAFIMPAITAFIVDITSERERPKALGFMSAAINTGFIIGPGIGGLLAGFGARAPFFAASIIAAIAVVISLVFLKELERKVVVHQNTPKSKGGMEKLFTPTYFIPLFLIFLSTFGLASFESLFSLFVDYKFNFTPTDIAIIVTGGGLVGAVAQVLLFERITNRIGEIALVRYCFVISALLVFFMTVVDTYLLVLITSCIVFVGFDLFRPAITTYLSKIAGDEQGFVGGMNSMFTSLGNIMGPIIGGILFDVNFNYPYYFATIVLIFAIIISFTWNKPKTL